MNCKNLKATDVGNKKRIVELVHSVFMKENCSNLFSNHYRFILWYGPYLNDSFQTFCNFQIVFTSKYCSFHFC